MKLDIKPALIQKVDTSERKTVLSFDFNFHIENNFKKEELTGMVLDYEDFVTIAKEIVAEYEQH